MSSPPLLLLYCLSLLTSRFHRLGTYNRTQNFQVIAPLFKLSRLQVASELAPAPRRLTPIVEGRKLGKEVKVDPGTVPLTGTFTVLFGSLSKSLASLFASPSPLVERDPKTKTSLQGVAAVLHENANFTVVDHVMEDESSLASFVAALRREPNLGSPGLRR
ncbi:hypothetical protein GYMLUDRAFT_235945 [Collybiopsis luxurians FD-317 M1]|nr:hypothetical protein GYMLUDRAFT_235945 [Collybiopsis luxurians FD-317 M1]